MSTIQELKDELEILMMLPESESRSLRTLALIGKILVHMEAYEKHCFQTDAAISSIENKMNDNGKVEINVRYR